MGFYLFSSNLPAPINEGPIEQTKKGNLIIEGDLTTGSFKMLAGAGVNKVLTTDASGVATWQTPATGATPGGTTGYVQFNDEGAFGSDFNLFWDNINERLGIGTTTPQTQLDVAGAIKIGTQATCDSNTEGAIRYNSVAKKFEGCNGVSWKGIGTCGEAVIFTYKGSSVTYGTVYNPATGECWMDRNLGASQVATAYDDSAAYGDLFQWGRLDDGHQTRTSGTTATLSSTDVPGHGNFITSDTGNDWQSPKNNNLWQGDEGINDPCPSGWRVPTSAELDAERTSWISNDRAGAFASTRKFTTGGLRRNPSASVWYVGNGFYWSAGAGQPASTNLQIAPTATYIIEQNSAILGQSVRCIKD